MQRINGIIIVPDAEIADARQKLAEITGAAPLTLLNTRFTKDGDGFFVCSRPFSASNWAQMQSWRDDNCPCSLLVDCGSSPASVVLTQMGYLPGNP